jgi:hypothetical protein
MNPDQLPPRVLSALRNLDYSYEEIRQMTPQEIFGYFCQWEGLIGWSDTLWETVLSLNTKSCGCTSSSEVCEVCLP